MVRFLKILILSSVSLVTNLYACEYMFEGTDQMTFVYGAGVQASKSKETEKGSVVKDIIVPKNCKTLTFKLKHTGAMPAVVMGHNFMIFKKDKKEMAVALAAKATENPKTRFTPKIEGEKGVILAGSALLLGGSIGDSKEETFVVDTSLLKDAMWACLFPGHSNMMAGSFILAAQ